MRFKRFLCFILAFIFIAAACIPALAIDTPPEIAAAQAAVYNVDTGVYVYDKNGDQRALPTALVKIMTALLVVEKCPDLFAEVASTDTALQELGNTSNSALRSGEIMTIKNLLYCMIINSANDAACVLAEHVGQDIPSFVTMMNQRAQELGMTGTYFTNPTGLHDANMYTTAYDMVTLVKHVSKNPELMEIFNTPYKRIPSTNLTASDRYYSTNNHLISQATYTDYFYQYASGILAGSTSDGGYCLATVSTKDKRTYICVILGSVKDQETKKIHSFIDAKNLLEYVHNHYYLLKVAEENAPIKEVPVNLAKGRDYVVLSPVSTCSYLMPVTATIETVEQILKITENITAPIEKGQILGQLTFVYNGKEYGSIPLAAQSSVERSGFLYVLFKIKTFFSSFWVKIFLVVAAFLILFYLCLAIYVNKKKKQRKHSTRNRYIKKK